VPRRLGTGADRVHDVVAHQRERRLVQGQIEHTALPGALPLEQGRHDRERRPGRRAEVDDRGADAHVGTPLLARDAHDPRVRLHQRVVPGQVRERAVPAEGTDRAVDEAIARGADVVRPDAEPLGRPRPEALDEHVRARRETEEDLPAPRRREVEPERALARVRGEEEHAPAGRELRPPGPRLVASSRMLHLDDVRSERADDLRAVRAGERGAHVDHPDAYQWKEGH
jgi:hypothetical protein